MLIDVPRLPRSYSESQTWTPDWRNRQAMAYLAEFQQQLTPETGGGSNEELARSLMREVRFPEWEDDRIVKARFQHMAGAAIPGSEWTKAFNWGDVCVRMDPSTQISLPLKAWLLAGLSDEEITSRFPLTTSHVMIFHNTWFDVRGHLQSPDVLLRVLCGTPLATDAADWERRERTVFCAALFQGAESVDRLLVPNDRLSDESLEWYLNSRRKLRKEIKRGRRAMVLR